MPGYNLKDYVTVAERLQAAQPDLQSVFADAPVMLTGSMGYIRVVVTLQDGRAATGIASFRLDLQGKGAQATNPIEDGETSAVGRALGMLGYGSKNSIASREEVEEAQRRETASYQQPQRQQASQKPRNVSEAKERFFARYGAALGGTTWRHAEEFLGVEELEPNTVEAWIDAAKRVGKREQELVEA